MPVIALPAAWFGGSIAVAAVASAVVTGAVYGAVIGAAVALATDGDILKGALTGAAIGGVTGGILQAGSLAAAGSSATSATTAGTSAAVSAAPGGVSAGSAQAAANAAQNAGGTISEGLLRTAPQVGGTAGVKSVSEMASQTTKEVAKKGMSEASSNIWGGAISGIGSGMGKVGAAMMESDTAKNLAETERKYEIDRVNRNVPGTAPRQSPSITLPQRWAMLTDVTATINKYKQPLDQGLLV